MPGDAPTIAALGLKVDSSEAAQGAEDLGKLADSAERAQAAAEGNASGFAKAGEAVQEFAVRTRREALALLDANEATRAFTGILAHLPGTALSVVASIAVLATAYAQGASESRSFAQSLALTGNALGLTVANLEAMARNVGAVTGNVHEAAAVLADLAKSGAVDPSNLQDFAQVAIEASRNLGLSVQQVAKQFEELGKDPYQASLALNQSLHQLDVTTLELIRTQQREGDVQGATATAQRAAADALRQASQQVQQYASYWERLSLFVTDVWDKLRDIGRQTPATQLAALQQQLQLAQASAGGRETPLTQRLRAEVAAQQALVEQQTRQAEQQASLARDRNEFTQQYIDLLKAVDVQSQATFETVQAQQAADQTFIQSAVAAAKAQVDNAMAVLDAQHQALLVSDEDYYAKRKKLIEQDAQVQIAGLQAQNTRIQQQIAAEQARVDVLRGNTSDQSAVVLAQSHAEAVRIQGQEQIKANLSEIATLTATAAAKITVSDAEQIQANRRLEASYLQLLDASNEYVRSLEQRYDLEISGAGQGTFARQRASDLAQITNHYADELKRLDVEHARGLNETEYARQRQVLEQGLAQAKSDWANYYKALERNQADWLLGAQEAYNNYVDGARNVAALTEQTFTHAFTSMEDAIVGFATTGKFSFKDLANSILADLVRMEVKILESRALEAIFGSVLGAYSPETYAGGIGTTAGPDYYGSITAHGSGGRMSAGEPGIVGDRGAELWVPDTSGTIIPNGMWQGWGGGGPTIVNYNNFGAGSQVAAIQADLDRRDAAITSSVYDGIRRGTWRGAFATGLFSR